MTEIEFNQTALEKIPLCPIRYSLDIVGGKWKLPIICMLSPNKTLRYNSIKRKLGDITNMMLSKSLKELEAENIVHREQFNEIPPHVEYSLTDKGNRLIPILTQFAAWGEIYMKNEKACEKKCSFCDDMI